MTSKTGAALCSLLLAAVCSFAQTQDPGELLAHARSTYSQEGPKAALPEFEKTLAAYRAAQNRRGEAITLGLIGNCYKRLGDYPKALDHLGRALAMKQELKDRPEEGRTLSHLGLVYWEMGEYAKSIEHLTRSIAIAHEIQDRQLEAAALNNLSLVYDEQGDYRHSLEQYQRALELHRAVQYPQGESDTLGNIGGVYLLLGRYREAMRYYQQALAISERLELKPSASQDLGNLATCHAGLGEFPEALDRFDRALTLAQQAGLKKEEADWYRGKASVLLRLGKFDQALELHRKALAVYESAGLKRELTEALNDYGSLHLSLGDRVSAEQSFRRALELSQSLGHARGVTTNLLALADLEWRNQRYSQSAELAGQALGRAREAGDRGAIISSLLQSGAVLRDQEKLEEALSSAQEALAAARATDARMEEAEALRLEGEIQRRRGRAQDALGPLEEAEHIARSAQDPDLEWQVAFEQGQALEALEQNEKAVAAYRHAVEIIEGVRSQIREERFRAGYLEDKQRPYVALVRLLLKLGRIDQAFLYSEKLRARGYLELLNKSAAPDVTDPREAELRARIRQLQQAIKRENEKAGKEQRSLALATFSDELAAAEREYQALLDDLRSKRPGDAALRTVSVPEAGQLQRRLAPGTALVEYVLGADELDIFVMTDHELHAKAVRIRSVDLEGRVGLLRDLIVRANSREWRRPAEELRRVLIEPIERDWLKGVTRLYLVPQGILHYAPFAALARAQGGGEHFLVEEYELDFLPAASALLHRAGPGSAEHTLLAMAPGEPKLQYAMPEARRVAEIFPGAGLALLGPKATEGAFKRLAGQYELIHLATHGFFNKANPIFSGVQLKADEVEDGRLEVHEILGMRLKARLVTLSACETALSSGYFRDIPAGDDFVGLTQAFLFAGSASVLASLWEVNDRSTAKLMSGFYQRLRTRDGAAALAAAQRAMIRSSGKDDHPYHWAAFVLVGSGEREAPATLAEKQAEKQ